MVGPIPRQGFFRDGLFLHPELDLGLQFPGGWKTVNQKQAVAAQSPEPDALLVLETQEPTGAIRVQPLSSSPRPAALRSKRASWLAS